MKEKELEVKEEPVEEVEEEAVEEKTEEYYILKQGEDLKTVAKKFKTTVKKIEELNNNATFIATNQIRVR